MYAGVAASRPRRGNTQITYNQSAGGSDLSASLDDDVAMSEDEDHISEDLEDLEHDDSDGYTTKSTKAAGGNRGGRSKGRGGANAGKRGVAGPQSQSTTATGGGGRRAGGTGGGRASKAGTPAAMTASEGEGPLTTSHVHMMTTLVVYMSLRQDLPRCPAQLTMLLAGAHSVRLFMQLQDFSCTCCQQVMNAWYGWEGYACICKSKRRHTAVKTAHVGWRAIEIDWFEYLHGLMHVCATTAASGIVPNVAESFIDSDEDTAAPGGGGAGRLKQQPPQSTSRRRAPASFGSSQRSGRYRGRDCRVVRCTAR